MDFLSDEELEILIEETKSAYNISFAVTVNEDDNNKEMDTSYPP